MEQIGATCPRGSLRTALTDRYQEMPPAASDARGSLASLGDD